MKPKTKRKTHNDLLIPILLTIVILPLITRMLLYDCGLSEYSWFSSDGIVTDFFSYYKSYFFVILSVVSAIILLIYFLIYRESFRTMKLFLPLSIYTGFILLSTIFSQNRSISIIGGISHFESVFVLLGYFILCIYTYQMVRTEQDLKFLQNYFFTSLVILGIIGLLQATGHDLMQMEWFQKLIIPSGYQPDYLGSIQSRTASNAVSFTLFNSNYAGVYLIMILSFFVPEILYHLFSSEKDTKNTLLLKKIGIGLLCLISFLLLAKTYSRAAFLAILVLLVMAGYFYRRQLRQSWKPVMVLLTILLVVFVSVDSLSQFRFIKKISATFTSLSKDKTESYTLESIRTNSDSIYIRYRGENLYVSFDQTNNLKGSLHFSNDKKEDLTASYDAKSGSLHIKPFDHMTIETDTKEQNASITIAINNRIWNFHYTEDVGYQYQNDFGKYVALVPVDSFGFHNKEYIASGRGYIWSRSLPLLKDTILIGSGPDTFPLVFPQWDYVGKANNCKSPSTLIEKPHNLYLMIGIQTGLLSLLAFLYFCFHYIIQSFSIYKTGDFSIYSKRIGLGCLLAVISYLVCGLFNDSSIQTSPLFWLFLGLGLASNQIGNIHLRGSR